MLQMISDTHLFKPVTDRVRQVDHHGGYTAGAGKALYTARNYPQEYWNRTAFVAEPTGHLVGTFVLQREGSNFKSKNLFNLVASDDEWTAPIMAEVGPDGNVWVIDWYNYIVQHNPTPIGFKTGKGAAYETDLRDKKYGRIYRIVYDGKTGKPFSLAGATPQQLVDTLKHENMFWRKQAQRLLVERGQRDVVPALIQLVRDPGVDRIGLNVGAIHALWTLHGLGALDGSQADATAAAYGALKHPSPGVRRNAVQVLPRNTGSVAAVLDAGLLQDPDAQVRLMTLLALADLPAAEPVGAALVAALSDPVNTEDRWIPDAATCAAARNSIPFLRALAKSKQPSEKLLTVAGIVSEHYARGSSSESIEGLITSLTEADPRTADAVVRGLAKGWPRDQSPRLTEPLEEGLERLARRLPEERQALLIRLAMTWGSKRFAKHAAEAARTLLARVRNESLSAEARTAAARELAAYRATDKETVQSLLELVTPRTPPDVAAGILRALQVSDSANTGDLVLERLAQQTPTVRAAGVVLLLSRPEWTRALLKGLEQGQVQLADLSLDQRQALAQHPDRSIRRFASDVFRKGGVLPNADRQKVLEEFLAITKVKGDAAAGKVVFKNQCAKCHVHSGEGQRIGPDLTGMAVHTKEHLLMDILDPSRSVEGNYRVYTVTTKAGTIVNGLLASESRTAVELIDAEAKRHSILRSDIDELAASPKSLMPEGFEKQVSRQELTDLLEFLTQRGKYVPLSLEKVATVVSTQGMFFGPEDTVGRLIFRDWTPKTFAGVPFNLVDPQGDRVKNVVLLYGPNGQLPPKLPRSVSLPCNMPAKAIHLLSGVSGWGYPYNTERTVSMIVRLHYADGKTEDHPFKNGEHFADYIRRVDVPGSQFAFQLRGQQMRYLAVTPQRAETIKEIELVKGPDDTAPIVMAVTVESLE
jgi:putative heme-binding domain-containing protein